MDFLLEAITTWLKEMLVGGIMSNLSGMFDSVNQQVADISVQVGQTPQGWNGSIFGMIQNLSNSIIVPIAGVILAAVMTIELIQMITDKNNLHDVDTWMIFKWMFKSAAAILMVGDHLHEVVPVLGQAYEAQDGDADQQAHSEICRNPHHNPGAEDHHAQYDGTSRSHADPVVDVVLLKQRA